MTSLWGKSGYREKGGRVSAGHIWAAGFHRVMACSHLVCIFKSMNRLFPNISNFFSGLGHLQITEATTAESMDTAVHLCLEMSLVFALPLYRVSQEECAKLR